MHFFADRLSFASFLGATKGPSSRLAPGALNWNSFNFSSMVGLPRRGRGSRASEVSANHAVRGLGIDVAAWVGAVTRVTQIMPMISITTT